MKNKKDFPKIEGKILFNEPLFKHTTFRIGGPSRVWVEPSNEDELGRILKFGRSRKKKIFIVGMGSNILFRDKGFNGIVIHLGNNRFRRVRFDGKEVIAGAGVRLSHLVNSACNKGLKGIEGLVGIPGTLGGAIFMNSGYRGNISDCLQEIKVMNKTNAKSFTMKRENIKFGYRHSNLDRYIILEATLRLKKDKRVALLKRKNDLLSSKKREQPLGAFSAGSIFKNPAGKIPAARYIDILGLKGKRIGDAGISSRHANFILNLKNAKARDILDLIGFIKKRVKTHFNINLVPEIKIL